MGSRVVHFSLFQDFFVCEPFLKCVLVFVTILLLLSMFWFFGGEARGILALQPATPRVLEAEVLTTGTPGKSPCH